MSWFLRKISDLFKEFDAFPVSASLRTKGDPESKSAFNGFISLMIYGVLAYLFLSAVIDLT